MIKPANEVWANQTNRADFDAACDRVMKQIEKASADGKRECLFNPYPSHLYDSVKNEFTKNGYRFKPYGYSGGVWQDAENICW